MKEIIPDIDAWLAQGQTHIALATVIHTWGSAPRKIGAKMAFTAGGALCGSVSGGCVEGAVIEAGGAVLASGIPQLLHFGVADETAWEVGLACGGVIDVFVEPLDPEAYALLREMTRQDHAGASVTVLRGSAELIGRKWIEERNGRSLTQLPAAITDQLSVLPASTQRLQLSDDLEIFVEQFRPAPTLIMVGGVHIAIALASMAKTLGFRTIVIDPRRAFGSDERFPHADQLLTLWPQKAFAQLEITPETAVALLTHDPKIDDPALEIVLPSAAFYVGALGSRKTHAKRIERLQQKGVDAAQISRIHAPIGLNLNAQTPEEIALSVLAEVVKTYRTESNMS
ncbi:MAG: XdhC family protein [Chloroflexota bacterium]